MNICDLFRETSSKASELEQVTQKFKKQNDQLKEEVQKLKEALDAEKKRRDFIGSIQDQDRFKQDKGGSERKSELGRSMTMAFK
jgi:hypothetical protein